MATSASVQRRVSSTKKRLLGEPQPILGSPKPLPKLNDLLNQVSTSPSNKEIPWKQKFNDLNTPAGKPSTGPVGSLSPASVSPDLGSSDLALLESYLKQQMAGSGNSGNMEALIANAVSGEYDPQIAAMQAEMKNTKTRGKAAKQDLSALYTDLSGYYDSKVKPTKNMYKAAKDEAKQSAKSLKQSITADYTERLKEQVSMYKQLGIEAAAPSATEGQYADQASQMAIADNQGSAMANALGIEEQADVNYWSQGAGIARTEGAEAQQDVIMQMQDILGKQGTTLAGLQGQKKAAYNTSLLKAQQAQQAAQGDVWDKMVTLAKLKQSAAKSGSPSREGLLGAMDTLGGNQNLANFFQEAVSAGSVWGNSPQAKLNYGGEAPNSPEELAQVIRDHAANKGMSPADQLKLWQAALVYYGRLK